MSEPNSDDTTPNSDRSEAAPRLRFVSARPDTKQGRREARAAIRAHASQASWAKIRKHGKQTRRDPISPIGSSQHTKSQRLSSTDEHASTELVSSSNDIFDVSISGRASASSQQAVPSRAARQAILDSISIPSPLRAVAVGDIDPFTSYPSRMPKEVATPIVDQGKPGIAPAHGLAECTRPVPTCVLADTNVSGHLPLLVNNFFNIMFLPDPERQEQSVVQHWISWYMNDSTLFHALCFAQLARSSTKVTELKPIDRRAYWYCYSEVVREVNRRFSDPSESCSDENILAVLALAFHGDATPDETDIPRSPSQGPMNSMQGLETYAGYLNPVSLHVNGLARMLSLRGGIADIEFPGLAAMLSYGDLLLASRALQKPIYPFVPIGESPELTLAAVDRAHHPLAQLGSGFRVLRDLIPEEESAEELLVTLQHLATYSLAVYDYVMGRPQALKLANLADQRNFVQHSLLSLNSKSNESREQLNSEDTFLLKEACWTSGAVYSLIAIFPVPHPKAPFGKLAKQLKQHLIYTSAHFARRWQTPSPLVLWMTFMGALASTADDESKETKAWYITVLERLVHRMLILSWENLREHLLKFLWFPSTSDTDGQQLWREIHTSNPFT
ncbi:hypothetical protein H2200_006787 [Cladophialophora chaetospira]|uniref:Tachykinin family protein n=1 Tax=Cladophialophora chaetospira TaxID=386627 RepID=A0AA38X8V6_9EURO|nr:hypothetical protein H2200_006787 [Cladophialophora chaetospira]